MFSCPSLCCGGGGCRPVNWFLAQPVFRPLSRLTYTAYLIHPLLITWAYHNQEVRSTKYALQKLILKRAFNTVENCTFSVTNKFRFFRLTKTFEVQYTKYREKTLQRYEELSLMGTRTYRNNTGSYNCHLVLICFKNQHLIFILEIV